jgi:hypothetical protein
MKDICGFVCTAMLMASAFHSHAAAGAQRAVKGATALSVLNAIPADQIVTEKVNAAVLRTVLEAFVAQQKFRDYEAPFTSGGSFWGSLAPRSGYGSATEYRAYIGRMRDIPRFAGTLISRVMARAGDFIVSGWASAWEFMRRRMMSSAARLTRCGARPCRIAK